ncbi:hypothetical protein CR513_56034, partial [Mucuna pruriens]
MGRISRLVSFCHSPFKLVYGFNLLTPLDLFPLPDMAFRLKRMGFLEPNLLKKLYERAQFALRKEYTNMLGKKIGVGRKNISPPNLRTNSLQERELNVNMGKDLGETQESTESMESTAL